MAICTMPCLSDLALLAPHYIIGFPGQFQTICNQFDISSNQFRPKCDRGKKSAFKFVFERSKSKTQQSNCKLRQSI